MATNKSIHTLNARGNIMLEVMRDYFGLSPKLMFRQIRVLQDQVERQLSLKGVSYGKLRSALVPDQSRKEVALVFDTFAMNNDWYGRAVFAQLIPLLDKDSNHSILHGDYLDRPGQADLIFEAFADAVEPVRPLEFQHPQQFYVVYINNLTDAMIERIRKGLADFVGYAGIADMTYASPFKILLSTMLVDLGVKHGRIIIQGHEPDRAPEEDVNMCGYPFEEHGYICRSISSDLMGVLLTYKIERPVYQGFEVDTEFSLNAISASPMKLDDLTVEVAEAKLAYIKNAKSGSVERAALEAITAPQLAELVKAKMSASYIYNLELLEEHDVAKFSIMLEVTGNGRKTRLMAALAYEPEKKNLRLLTLY